MLDIASRAQGGFLHSRCSWTTWDETSWEGSDRLRQSHTSQGPGDEQINFSPGYYTLSVADDSWDSADRELRGVWRKC